MEVWESMPTPPSHGQSSWDGCLQEEVVVWRCCHHPFHQQWEKPTPAASRYGPRNEPSTPSAGETFWHPLHLFGFKEEDMEKEGEGLIPTSSNLQLQEDSFFANSFHSLLLPVISTKGWASLKLHKLPLERLIFRSLLSPIWSRDIKGKANMVPC